MDLVPYDSESRQIVLRHGNTLVVFDERSEQLSTTQVQKADVNECPYCHRAYKQESEPILSEDAADDDAFVSPTYFKRLASSHNGTPAHSSSPSRRWRLVQSASSNSSGAKLIDSKSTPVSRKTSASGSRISSSSFSQGYFKTFFISERELGRGGKGVVLLVKHVLDGVTLGRFACKRVPVGDSHEWLENVLLEVSLLQDMAHENLVAYRHVWLEDFQATTLGPSTPHVFILQQFCNSGTLLEHVLGPKQSSQAAKDQLKDRARRFSRGEHPQTHGLRSGRRLLLDEIFSFFKDITSGLAHLHANGYVHRDLKPQNCLLHRSGGTVRALVSDFGEMQGMSTPRRPTATGYTGTISFAAPEIIGRDRSGAFGRFTDKSDVFSLGMVVFFMCFGRLPYTHADLEEEKNEDLAQLKAEILAWTGLKEERRERTDLPEKLYGFLQLLLSHDPNERPSTESILQGIRGGSAFNEHHPTSPTQDHHHSPDPGADIVRPSSSHAQSSTMKRRHSKYSRPGVARASSSGSASHQFPNHEPDFVAADDDLPPTATSTYRAESATTSSDDDLIVQSQAHVIPLLMPPPEPSPGHRLLRAYARAMARHPRVAISIKLALFIGKIWSLFRPCQSVAVNPMIAYPLLTVGALDLAGHVSGLLGSMIWGVLHIVILYLATRSGTLCQAGRHPDWLT